MSEGGEARERYAALVLSCVEQVPRGRVTTYGAVAAVLREITGGGGPRQVARVMAAEGAAVPWWRCVRADGTVPEHLAGAARVEWLVESTPRTSGSWVDLREAFVAAPTPDDGGRPSQ